MPTSPEQERLRQLEEEIRRKLGMDMLGGFRRPQPENVPNNPAVTPGARPESQATSPMFRDFANPIPIPEDNFSPLNPQSGGTLNPFIDLLLRFLPDDPNKNFLENQQKRERFRIHQSPFLPFSGPEFT